MVNYKVDRTFGLTIVDDRVVFEVMKGVECGGCELLAAGVCRGMNIRRVVIGLYFLRVNEEKGNCGINIEDLKKAYRRQEG